MIRTDFSASYHLSCLSVTCSKLQEPLLSPGLVPLGAYKEVPQNAHLSQHPSTCTQTSAKVLPDTRYQYNPS